LEKDTILAEMIQEYWEDIGVEVNLVPVAPDALVRDYLEPRTYEAALVTLQLYESPDPDPYPFWHQAMIDSGQNFSQWDDRRASEYLERARVTPNRLERTRLYRNFQLHFSRQVPAIPLFYKVYNYGIDQQVVGVQIGPLYDPSDRFDTIYEWALETGPVIEEAPQEEAAP
jgi:peptide/nickel transport system substrate-binding protein